MDAKARVQGSKYTLKPPAGISSIASYPRLVVVSAQCAVDSIYAVCKADVTSRWSGTNQKPRSIGPAWRARGRCGSGFGLPRIWSGRTKFASRFGPPSADLVPRKKQRLASRSLMKANTLAGWRKMFILHLAIFIRCVRSSSVGLCHVSGSVLRRTSRDIVLVIVHCK